MQQEKVEQMQRKKSIPKPNLKPVCRLSNVSNKISSKLDRLIPMNTETRIEKSERNVSNGSKVST